MPDSNPTPHAETRERIEFSFSLPWHAVGPVFDAPASDAARIQVYAPMGGGDSYAGVAAAVAGEIAASFDAVALCDYTGGEPRVPALRERHGLNRRADVAVFLGFPTHVPDWFFDHPVTIGLFVCEADRILPEWVRLCNRFDLVVVPSTFCRTAFRASGVTAPLAVVPHGVHPVFRPGPRTRRDDRLVFHAAFRHHVAERKGYPQLRRAFSRAFAGRTDVALSIATTDRRWLPAAEPDPRVEFLPAWDVGVEEIAQRYRDADCVVCPSRGEGFGLVPLEAIACGTPVISPAHTGLADFLTEDNAIVLEPGALIRAPRIDHLCGLYYDVDESDLERCLRRAADRLDDERERARRASGDIRARYPWRVVLEPLVRLVGEGLRRAPTGGFGEAVEPFADRAGLAFHHEDAERRAQSRPGSRGTARLAAEEDARKTLAFSSIVYCGWDNPRDSIGNHLRLLDGLVFDRPEVRYKSLDELPSDYQPEPYRPPEPFIHEQRPDLFQGCLYLDVVGIHGGEEGVARQIARVKDAKRRFGAAAAIYLMWETDRLWDPLEPLLAANDLTIVTTDLLAGDLDRRGIPFAVLPHPYEYTVERPAALAAGTPNPLVFGISAPFWRRKNLLSVVDAFADLFGGDPSRRLRVHTRLTAFGDAQREVADRVEAAASRHDNIELVVDVLSRADYLDWMRSLDVYVYLSSGEGWSVTPREALHLGKPVILLDAHAHRGLSRLPGVVAVPPGAPRKVTHDLSMYTGNVGCDAGLDDGAFRRALASMPDVYPAIQNDLAERFDAVLAHHDIVATGEKWVDALNRIDRASIR